MRKHTSLEGKGEMSANLKEYMHGQKEQYAVMAFSGHASEAI